MSPDRAVPVTAVCDAQMALMRPSPFFSTPLAFGLDFDIPHPAAPARARQDEVCFCVRVS